MNGLDGEIRGGRRVKPKIPKITKSQRKRKRNIEGERETTNERYEEKIR
jgi:hypothetical protein